MKHFKIFWKLFDSKNKKIFYSIIFLFIIQSFLEAIGIASVIPFITVIFNPESLSSISFFENYTEFLEKNRNNLLPIFCLIFLFIFVIKNIFLIFIYRFKNSFVNNLRAFFAKEILVKFFHQEYLFFAKKKQGELITTLNTETLNLTKNFLDAVMILLSEIIILFGILFLILIMGHFKGVLIIFPILFIAGFIVKKLNKEIKSWANQRVELSENLATLSQRIFLGIRDIYLSSNADHLINKFYNINKEQSHMETKNSTIQLMPKALIEILGLSILLSTVFYFNNIGMSQDFILTNLTFYFVIAYRAIPAYNKILIQYQRIKYSKNSVDLINSTLSLSDDRVLSVPINDKIDFNRNIKINNFDFSYDNKKDLINNFSIEIKKGEIIGLFGQSGSGKSTLLNLITLLIKPTSGKLFLDDELINSNSEIRKYQDLITFISQDTFLVEDTIKNNIIFNSTSKVDAKQLKFSIDFAQIDKFVNDLPNGIDYMVGSHSRRISSGQKQRIAIARAIYSANDMIIFDEATNALDEENEKAIISNIYSLRGKKTIIIVSHNKNNLDECDKIIEIRDKKIIQIK